ncbi:hypothetical protein EFK50_17340 [Nocardioides marmoriginsengisoli]|uniref:Uncharacterized protein n=1 Tax=Nocardioides marmoriginsengisoli TaxID=661483 RepID=A0A3N0CDK3_9ACTN|nr:hypothetical protein [Nocardioides marmoriginsengisoli]RNL61136.1 hypothetical protein EFK50_17340 [Nocardioides marmoriginsengisoli]
MSNDWRTDLADAVARGLAQDGPDAVGESLRSAVDALADHPDAEVAPWCPPVPILGVVACASGSLGVLLRTDGRVTVHLAAGEGALHEQVRSAVEDGVLVAAGAPPEDVPTRDLLRRAGITAPAWFSGSGFTEDDLLRACGFLLTAPR